MKNIEGFQAWYVSSDSPSLDFQVIIPREICREIKFTNSFLHRLWPWGIPAMCQAAPWIALAFKAARERPRKREGQRRKLVEDCHSNREVGNLQSELEPEPPLLDSSWGHLSSLASCSHFSFPSLLPCRLTDAHSMLTCLDPSIHSSRRLAQPALRLP